MQHLVRDLEDLIELSLKCAPVTTMAAVLEVQGRRQQIGARSRREEVHVQAHVVFASENGLSREVKARVRSSGGIWLENPRVSLPYLMVGRWVQAYSFENFGRGSRRPTAHRILYEPFFVKLQMIV